MAGIQDPDAVLDHGYNWSQWLGTDTIATSSWTVETGLTKSTESHDTTSTTVWLSGGEDGKTYKVTNHITTTEGRTDERSFRLQIRER